MRINNKLFIRPKLLMSLTKHLMSIDTSLAKHIIDTSIVNKNAVNTANAANAANATIKEINTIAIMTFITCISCTCISCVSLIAIALKKI